MALPTRTSNPLAPRENFNLHLINWNIQGGLRNQCFTQMMTKDLIAQDADLACLQETHCGEFATQTQNGGLITCLGSDADTPVHKRYGLGFYIGPRLLPHYWGTIRISNRIAVIRFLLNNGKTRNTYMSVINAYAPTALTTQRNLEETNAFYYQLALTYETYRCKSTFTLVAGDFNAKLGLQQDIAEKFMGKYGKGTRNENGKILAEFLIANRLCAANTLFEHKSRYRSTWHGVIQNKIIHNQIDYTLIPQRLRHLAKDSKSIHKHDFSSDHSMVKTTLNLSEYFRTTKQRRPKTPTWNLHRLISDPEARRKYQEHVQRHITEIHPLDPVEEQYNRMTSIIQEAAQISIPNPRQQIKASTTIQYFDSPTVQALSKKQAQLRHAIIRKLSDDIENPLNVTARRRLIKKRRRIIQQLHKVIKELQCTRINELAEELERHKGDRKTFEITRLLRAHTYQELALKDEDGSIQTNPAYLLKAITDHYDTFFNQADINPTTRWTIEEDGLEITFTKWILPEEVKKARMKLTNARAAGKDATPGELYKYAPDTIDNIIAGMLNMLFIGRENIAAINEGILIVINKPNKPLSIKETRPITLLNSYRKILSLILLERIYPDVERYIGPNASGFRRGRSSGDILWTYRWLIAAVKKYHIKSHTIGLDMSKAFDCINRGKLLTIMKAIISPTDFQILKYLLTDTTLTPRVKGELGASFNTSIGTPQGDALSPLLFVVYLEAAEREATAHLIATHGPEPHGIIHLAPVYADDLDHTRIHIDPTQQEIAEIRNQQHLQAITSVFKPKFNIQINASKTEIVHISQERLQSQVLITQYNHRHQTHISPLTNKKLGSKLEPSQDIVSRIQQANIAYVRLQKIWQRHKLISIKTRIRIFQACITSILTYNLSSLGVSDSGYDKLDAYHRTKLRHILGIHHPYHIENPKLYQITKTEPISNQIHALRWKLFGHILRGPSKTPAMISIHNYFKMTTMYEPKPGKPPVSIASVLDKDLQCGHGRYPIQIPIAQLKDITDLRTLKALAADRRKWTQLWTAIIKDRTIRTEEQYQRRRQKRKNREETSRHSLTRRTKKRITFTPLTIKIRRPSRRQRRRTDNDPETEHPEYNMQHLRHADRDFIAAHSFSDGRRL
jgi:exonuclease III